MLSVDARSEPVIERPQARSEKFATTIPNA